MAKILFEGAQATWSSILILVCCTRTLSLAFQFGGWAFCLPLGYAYDEVGDLYKPCHENFIHLLLAKLLLDLQQRPSFDETFFSKIFFADSSKKKIQLSNLKNDCKVKF